MKYYSDVTKKLYDDEKTALKAEEKFLANQRAEEAKKKELSETRAKRAKEIEDAYKAVLEANNKYIELKNKFIDDYGSFHMSFSTKTPVTTVEDLFNLLF